MSSHIRILDKLTSGSHGLNHLEKIIPSGGALNTALVNVLLSQPHIPFTRYPMSSLASNEGMMSDSELDKLKIKLIESFDLIVELTGHQPLVLIRDNCVTNDRLIDSFKEIFGDELLEKYVSQVNVNYRVPFNQNLQGKITKDSILMMGGSRTNVFEMHNDWIYGAFADIFLQTLSDHPSFDRNNCIIGICHGQNYILHLLNLLNSDSRSIQMTHKGPAHFGPCHVNFTDLKYVAGTIREAMAGLTNNGLNPDITASCTRSSKNNFDIFQTGTDPNVTILASDNITGDPLLWALKNGRGIGSYFHPEIKFVSNTSDIVSVNESVVPMLASDYGERQASSIIRNYENIGEYVKRDIDKAFFIPSLLAFSNLIINNIKLKSKVYSYSYSLSSSLNSKSTNAFENEYAKFNQSILALSQQRLSELLEGFKLSSDEMKMIDLTDKFVKSDYLAMVDKARLLPLNARSGRIVNRGLTGVSREFCVENIGELINKVVAHVNNVDPNFSNISIIRDLGCGNGTFMKEYDSFKDRSLNIGIQGVSKEIPFDLLQGMLNSEIAKKYNIPQDVLIFINALIIQNYRFTNEMTLLQQISEIIVNLPKNNYAARYLKFDTTTGKYYYNYHLPFYKDIFRPKPRKIEFSDEGYRFLVEKMPIVLELLGDIKRNLYSYFDGYPERIFISDFENLKFDRLDIAKAACTISTKGTSQVISPRTYSQILEDFIIKFSRPGSVDFDNGVMASYTSISRVKELMDLQHKHNNIKIKVIYDASTNYICGAVIMKAPYFDHEIIQKQLLKGFTDGDYTADAHLVDITEVSKCTYVLRERFIRDYLLSTFRSYDVFWFEKYKNSISDYLIEVMGILKLIATKKDESSALLSHDSVSKIDFGRLEEIDQQINELSYSIKLKLIQLVNGIVSDLNIFIRENDSSSLIEYNPIDINMLESYSRLDTKDNINKLLSMDFYIPEWFNINGKRKFQ